VEKLNKIITTYNKLFVLWVIAGAVVAFFHPQIFTSLKKFMELFFALTMFGIGAVLKRSDFTNIFKHWWLVLVGVCAQFTIMPLSAFALSKVFNLSKEFSLGLILTGSAPGAMASNVFCFLAGADVAYSVSLTTVSTLLSPLLTPFLTLILAHEILDIPFWSMFLSVVKMVVLPLLLGFFLRSKFDKKIEKISIVFPAISITFIVFICSLVIALNKTYLLKMSFFIFILVLILNLSGLFLGYFVARCFRFDALKRRSLTIEIGMQNAGLGSVLALKHFNEVVAIPAAIFVFVCIFTASILVGIWQKQPKTI